jgi:hypothetical protein
MAMGEDWSILTATTRNNNTKPIDLTDNNSAGECKVLNTWGSWPLSTSARQQQKQKHSNLGEAREMGLFTRHRLTNKSLRLKSSC